MKSRLQIVYQDEWIIGVNKPSGLLSIPDRYDVALPSVSRILQRDTGEIFVVHRLDKQTSGIMLFARDADTHRFLNKMFMDRKMDKTYLVFVQGRPPAEEGLIDRPIGRDPSGSGKMTVHPAGKPSKTAFRTREVFRDHSLVEAKILSGRTHQIRVHLPSGGMPLSVDPLYGNAHGIYLSSFKTRFRRSGRKDKERPLLDRLSLHAWKLGFEHPQTENIMELEAPLPKDMRALLKQLRKWNAV